MKWNYWRLLKFTGFNSTGRPVLGSLHWNIHFGGCTQRWSGKCWNSRRGLILCLHGLCGSRLVMGSSWPGPDMRPPYVLQFMCMGGSSRLLRCLEPKMSRGFQVLPHQQTCSGTNEVQLRHATCLLTQCNAVCWPKFSLPSLWSMRALLSFCYVNALLLGWAVSVIPSAED